MSDRIHVYVAPEDDTVISSIFCEQDSISPRCQLVIDLIKELTSVLQSNAYHARSKEAILEKLSAYGVDLGTIREYLLCNLTLREALTVNRVTRDCWILALQRMDFTQRQIADAIQLGQHFACRCRQDQTLDPLTLVTNTILRRQPPAGLQFPIPTL